MPSTIVTKTCPNKGGEEPFSVRPLKIYPTQNLVVASTTYPVEFQPQQLSREYDCLMHSFNSWKNPSQIRALSVYANGGESY
jgi:hypothetical protein